MPCTIGYVLDTSPIPGNGKFSMMYPYISSEGIVMTKRQSTPDALRACATSLHPDTLELVVQPSLNPRCWPITQVLYSQVPTAYPLRQRNEGYAGLSLVAWALSSPELRSLSESHAHSDGHNHIHPLVAIDSNLYA